MSKKTSTAVVPAPRTKAAAATKTKAKGQQDAPVPPAKAPESHSKANAPPTKGGGDGPGVIASIAEFLATASDKAPMSKAAIVAKLVERFPDRPESSLKSTVAQQVPTKLRSGKGFNVQKADGGYFIKT